MVCHTQKGRFVSGSNAIFDYSFGLDCHANPEAVAFARISHHGDTEDTEKNENQGQKMERFFDSPYIAMIQFSHDLPEISPCSPCLCGEVLILVRIAG